MTDPFADLERELLAAHARTPRRRFPAVPGIVATVALLAVFVALAGWLAAPSDPERAAAPQPTPSADSHEQPVVTPADDCQGGPWTPPQSDQPMPDAITGELAVFRAPSGPDEAAPDPRMTGRQAARVYADGRRTLPRSGKYGVHAIAAEILPRDQVGQQDHPCAAPQGALEPGVCLVLTHEEGAMSACFTLAEINEGEAFVDAGRRIMGLAPDGARTAKAGGAVAEVVENSFTLPGGPESKVDFEP